MFLSQEEIAELTDARWHAKQIAALKQMRIPFFVSPAGKPKVTRAAVEGRKEEVKQRWEPRL